MICELTRGTATIIRSGTLLEIAFLKVGGVAGNLALKFPHQFLICLGGLEDVKVVSGPFWIEELGKLA